MKISFGSETIGLIYVVLNNQNTKIFTNRQSKPWTTARMHSYHKTCIFGKNVHIQQTKTLNEHEMCPLKIRGVKVNLEGTWHNL